MGIIQVSQNNNDTYYGRFVIISSGGLLLSYSFSSRLKEGQLVFVPLKQGKIEKTTIGVFIEACKKPDFSCRPIHEELPLNFRIKKTQISLLQKVTDYYLTPFEWGVRLLAPGYFWNAVKVKTAIKYLEKLYSFEENDINQINESPLNEKKSVQIVDVLNTQQKYAYDFILNNLSESVLLHGVTGSGKTEVYLAVAQHVMSIGKSCLILVPEISLTPQMALRFEKVFGDQLSVLHSGISSVSLLKEWLSVYSGKTKIVLGVRSAVFCPIDNLGLIVVDEEHDQSYKCSEKPCYHARDVAVMRAKAEGACCLLGSATPSLESFFNTQNKKYKYVALKTKYAASTEVQTVIIETKKENNKFKLVRQNSKECHVDREVIDLIKKNNEKNFQTIILLNRRGFVNYALCESCRKPLSCPNCSVATTIHNFGKREICHYCDFNREIRKSCPLCEKKEFLLKGIGTQNIEAYLKEEIKNFQVERLDRDTITSHTRLKQILNRFVTKETDCLVGTQILAKGHDFPNVTLIVILNLEDGLFLPDFRAAEKTFHLLTQSIGRVGRGQHNGMIVMQSRVKNHPVLELALSKNVSGFLERELKNRARAHLPPYTRLILIEIKHKHKIFIEKLSIQIKERCIEHWKIQNFNVNEAFISGPYDAPIEKINNIYRVHLCINISKTLHPNRVVPKSIYAAKDMKHLIKIDVDPQNFM